MQNKKIRVFISVLVLLLTVFSLGVPSLYVSANDKPLTQLIKEAEAQKSSLLNKKKLLKNQWNKNQNLILDLSNFRDKAQSNTERGVVSLGSRLFKIAAAPLIRNYGYGLVNQLVEVNLTSTKTVANTTVRWSKLRDRANTLINTTQNKQKQLLTQMKQIDDQIAKLDSKIKSWQKQYDNATGKTTPKTYDYQAALAAFAKECEDFYQPGVVKETSEYKFTEKLEWIVRPYIDGNNVMMSYQAWTYKTYPDGRTEQYVGAKWAPDKPEVVITVDRLKEKFPQFWK